MCWEEYCLQLLRDSTARKEVNVLESGGARWASLVPWLGSPRQGEKDSSLRESVYTKYTTQ